MTMHLYIRRSTDDQADSLDNQRALLRDLYDRLRPRHPDIRWPTWELRREHVDDDFSGSDFKSRPGLASLIASVKSGDVVLSWTQERMGRDTLDTPSLERQLTLDLGARLFYYDEDAEISGLDSPEVLIMRTVKAMGPHAAVKRIRANTRDGFRARVGTGRWHGGACYGYDLVRQFGADRKPSTTAKVNLEQAAVVVRIYDEYLAGRGLKRIAAALNRDGIPAPRAGRRGTGSWATNSVREILIRERYRGVDVYGEQTCIKRVGKRKVFVKADPSRVKRIEVPAWRIVSDEVWQAAQAAMQDRRRDTFAPGPAAKYSLTSIGRCLCGGAIIATRKKVGTITVPAYGCCWHHTRGPAVCGVTVRQPVSEVDAAFAREVQKAILRPDIVDEVLRLVREEADRSLAVSREELAPLEAQLAEARKEIANYVRALAKAPDVDELAEELRRRKDQARILEGKLEAAKRTPAMVAGMMAKVEKATRARLERLRADLAADPASAREVYRSMFPDRLRFSPIQVGDRRGWHITGEATADMFKLGSDPSGI